MASCNKCGRDVGCGCNLISGYCPTCYNSTLDNNPAEPRTTKRIVYTNNPQPSAPPSEFELILQTPGISKEEKINRINAILNKATDNL